jgi:hypothetical protein
MTCTSGVCTPTSSSAVLNVNDLQTMLASSNVTLAAAGQPVDVDVNASPSWVSTSKLTLDSYHSINVNQSVAITGGGGLSLITNDGGTGGAFAFMPGANVAFFSLSSSLEINGSTYTLVDDIATLASDIAANPGGSYALVGNYNAKPDGTYSQSPITTEFAGNFQGMGNTISNLSVSSNAKKPSEMGLFSMNGSSGVIDNVNLQSAEIAESGEDGTVGGVVGSNEGLLFGDHFSGVVAGGKSASAGGVVGYNQGTVAASSAAAAVTVSQGSYVGDLVGWNRGAILISYATGVSNAKASVGGLVGYNDGGALTNSYATGATQGKKESYVGGLAGIFQGGTIDACYSTGHVKGGFDSLVGGFLGQVVSGPISSSYWDTTTSKTKNAAGNAKNVPGVTGKTTAQLQSGLPAGFDSTVWAESPSIDNGLPYLIANPPQ